MKKQIKLITAALLLVSGSAHAVTLTFTSDRPLTIMVDKNEVELKMSSRGEYVGKIENLSPDETYKLKSLHCSKVLKTKSYKIVGTDNKTIPVDGCSGSFMIENR